MAKITTLLIVLFALAGVLYFNLQYCSPKLDIQTSASFEYIAASTKIKPVAVASVSIEKGEYFYESNVEIKELDEDMIPNDAVSDTAPFLERRAAHTVPAGQILAFNDVLPADKAKMTGFDKERELSSQRQTKAGYEVIVYATRDIQRGEPLESIALEQKEMEVDNIPTGAVHALKEVIGKTAKSDIFQGQVIMAKELKDR